MGSFGPFLMAPFFLEQTVIPALGREDQKVKVDNSYLMQLEPV